MASECGGAKTVLDETRSPIFANSAAKYSAAGCSSLAKADWEMATHTCAMSST